MLHICGFLFIAKDNEKLAELLMLDVFRRQPAIRPISTKQKSVVVEMY